MAMHRPASHVVHSAFLSFGTKLLLQVRCNNSPEIDQTLPQWSQF
jgi:hypothetical protein